MHAFQTHAAAEKEEGGRVFTLRKLSSLLVRVCVCWCHCGESEGILTRGVWQRQRQHHHGRGRGGEEEANNVS